MVINRDKDYRIYLFVYVFTYISILLIYIFGCDESIGFAFLINSPVLFVMILGLISTGRTFIMDQEGCTVCFWKFRRKYTWEELQTRKIEEYCLPSMFRGKLSCPYTKEAFAAPYKIRKPRVIRSNLYSLFHPFSFIFINFSLENEEYQHGRYYEVKEAIFREKMKEWGVMWEDKS